MQWNRWVVWMALGLSAGCGRETTSVNGCVIFDGKPLDRGFITFFPENGPAATQGAEIHNGKFSLADLSPGKKRVLIRAWPRVQKNPQDNKSLVFLFPDHFSDSAPGNNRVVNIVAGHQVQDFHLKKEEND